MNDDSMQTEVQVLAGQLLARGWRLATAESCTGGLIAATGRRIVLAADGGIRDTTVPLLRAAGAETVVIGSLAFGAPDLAERMRWLHAL